MFCMQELVQPLDMALQLGLQYPPLAAVAVTALEAWESQPSALLVLAPQVVPLMDPYLRSLSGLDGIVAVPPADGTSPTQTVAF